MERFLRLRAGETRIQIKKNTMKKLLLLFAILCSAALTAQEINWMTMEEALAAQEKEPRKIIVDVYTNWCGPCKLMDKRTFGNKDVVAFVNKHYYAVKFNGEGEGTLTYKEKEYDNPNFDPARVNKRNGQHRFAAAMGVQGYPTVAFFDENGNFIQPITGFRTPQQLEVFLKMIENDDYKILTTQEAWEAYQERFESTFKG